jgi:hypothetical protein
VREHGPETPHRRCRYTHAELREVALEKRAQEIFAPRQALLIRAREERFGKPAAQPQPVEVARRHFALHEAAHLDERDSAGKRLRSLSKQIGRCAAE